MDENADRFIVITGGPGSGKTALLDALQREGYARSVEAGRAIIQGQVTIGGPALPWNDRALFSELMLSWEMRSYEIARNTDGFVFFDRGVPDVIGYRSLCGLPVPDYMRRAAAVFRYHRRVFIAPPWQEIFRQDEERKQDFEEAVRTHKALAASYAECGYELVELPRLSVIERVRFVTEKIRSRN
ncbi:MAG TPA: AAA family ATPase [Candidatus Sulfotelmatobacter sp.]|nr:AAA family ATPase [Candidatus Sulfotelmatobacter sp.]